MREYLSKKAVLEFIKSRKAKFAGSYKDIEYGAYLELETIETHIESGAFDADESEGTWKATAEVLGRENAQLDSEIQRLRAALASLPDKIMDMKWTDTEELTFPLDNPTAEEQSEWLDEFIDRLDMHVRNIIDNEIEALSTTTEPCVCESIKCECGHHKPTGAERVKIPHIDITDLPYTRHYCGNHNCPVCGINAPKGDENDA